MATTRGKAGRLTLLGIIYKEDAQFVSRCPELGVASCGDTVEEATANLKDALRAYLEALRETGELQRVLEEKGLTVEFRPPAKSIQADIPRDSFVALLEEEVHLLQTREEARP